MSNDAPKMVACESADANSPQDTFDLPICLRCRAAPMSLTCTKEEYPGYQKRMFECPVCGDTMTQWAAVSLPQTRRV